jgi:hypothetical protein
MNTTNKTDTKAITTSETAKVANKPVITTQPELKKPNVDIKKPEVPEKAPISTNKEPIIPVKESDKPSQLIPVVTKPELATKETAKVINKPVITIQPELNKQRVDVKKAEVPEKSPITTAKESVVPANEPAAPIQSEPVIVKPESAKPEQSKNPTKSDKAKAIYDEMIKIPNNDRTTIIAKIKKDLVLTKAGALSYFYKFQRESGRVTEKQPSKMDKAKEVYEKMILDGQSRKDIIAAFVKEVELTPAGASTYYQNLKKLAEKPTKA